MNIIIHTSAIKQDYYLHIRHMSKKDIINLQKILNSICKKNKIIVDGYYGSKTNILMNECGKKALSKYFSLNLSEQQLTLVVDLIHAAKRYGIEDNRQIAYILATVKIETGGKYVPVSEAFYLRLKNRLKYLRSKSYFPYYGRGYIQITWFFNYLKFKKILGLDIVKHPDMVLSKIVARDIMFYGMTNGTFTGKKLSNYINDTKCDYVNARRIINGRDKATEIASDAIKFEYLINKIGDNDG